MTIHSQHDELNRQLQSIGTEDKTVILIADQAALAHHKTFGKFAHPRAAHNLLHESATAFDGASPLVIDITNLPGNKHAAFQLDALLDAAKWACGLSVVVTPLSFPDALVQLRARCIVTLPDNLDMVLRYFDTRILPVLLWALDPAQRAAFTAMSSAWLYLDRDGTWCAADIPTTHAAAKPVPPLRLSSSQQDALINAGECDAVLNRLRTIQCQPLLAMTAPEQYRQVAVLVAKAHALGIQATATVALFCAIELSQAKQLETNPAWQKGLCEVRDKTKTFDELLKELA